MRTKLEQERGEKDAMSFDPEEISILLLEGEAEQRRAITLINQHLRRVMIYKIRVCGLGLTSEEIIAVYNEVLMDVWKAAVEKRYDANQPLEAFLFTVAHRRAIDRWRRKRRNKEVSENVLLDEVSNSLRGTEVGAAWCDVAAKENGRKMMDLFRRAVTRMPARQRQVGSVMIDKFPDVPTLQQICDEIYETTGERITVVSAKRARQQVRKKVREELVDAGYLEDETNGRTNGA